ncbi:MAG TPA: S53 family peptidase [Steroidobacteraceae bacterium]|nr:S53 family peptidase [Steroidobacteraceae bacterium]
MSVTTVTARRWIRAAAMAVVLAVTIEVVSAATPAEQIIAHNTPPYVSAGTYVKPESPTTVIEVTVWLNTHDRAAMDALARELYDPSSPNYRRWLTRQEIAERFAPSANEAATVRQFLESHNLQVLRTGNDNFFVRARGTVGDVQNAFQVRLNDYRVHGQLVRANDRDPLIQGAAAPLVRAVAGLDTGVYTHPVVVRPTAAPVGTAAGRPLSGRALAPAAVSAQSSFYSSHCFTVGTQTLSTNADGELPMATYSGEQLNLQTVNSPGCAYTPPVIRTAYHLNGLYAKGYTGRGQTIAIIDWCGSSTIESDANAFAAKFGLPKLNAANFQIIYTPTPSECVQEDQVEINLDVEWAHAVAPGADIALVVPPSATLQDVDEAEFYAVNYDLANSISGSFGSPESETPASYLATENLIAEIAALSGISTNFSSGDYGDYVPYLPKPTVSAPADSPWATAVGGVSLALNADDSIAWQSGWGNGLTMVDLAGTVSDPPSSQAFGFYFGSGGGPSTCASQDDTATGIKCLAGYPKPSFQSKLPGTVRRVPDVSWLADPFTGVAIAISIPGQEPAQVWQVVGGTSLACPMFSALWAIANQAAGAPLGQAARYLYSMPADTLSDVVPVAGGHDVTATVEDANGTKHYTAAQLLGSQAPAAFVSATADFLSNDGNISPFSSATEVISFGTDCSAVPAIDFGGTPCTSAIALHTAPGWDDVTGLGTPNAQAFVEYFTPGAASAR